MKKTTLFAALLISAASFAQTNPIKLTKGQKFKVVTEVNQTSTSEVMGQSMENKSQTTITELYDVENASANSFVVDQKIKRMEVKAQNMGQEMTFDSDKDEDKKSEIGSMMTPVLDAKYTITMDATGNITAVESKQKGGEADNGMLQMMGINGTTFKQGARFQLSVLPNDKLKTGLKWTATSTADKSQVTTDYTITGIQGDDILIDYVDHSDVNMTQEIMGQSAEIKGTNKGSGKLIVDKKSGLVRSRDGVINVEATVAVQGMEIPTKSSQTIKSTVTAE